jgi:hypothetical protein
MSVCERERERASETETLKINITSSDDNDDDRSAIFVGKRLIAKRGCTSTLVQTCCRLAIFVPPNIWMHLNRDDTL